MSTGTGHRLSAGLLRLWFQAQTTQPIWHRWGWATRRQIFHKWAPLCQFQLLVLDTKAVQKLTSSLGCSLNQLGEKCNQPLSCLCDCTPSAQAHIKTSLLNIFHTDMKYLKRKGRHCSFLPFMFWKGQWKVRDTVTVDISLKVKLDNWPAPVREQPSESALSFFPRGVFSLLL